ncbi:MAG TPA: MBL fold metallo-hydrolase [Bacillaceae bacterium]
MEWKKIPLGPIQTNCYLLYNEERQCVIFDPGSEGDRLNAEIEEEGLNPIAILLTHAHFDHIGAVEKVRYKWNIPVYIHEAENDWLTDPSLNGSIRYPMIEPIVGLPADHAIAGDGKLSIGPFTFRVLETPGHSPGSLSFYIKEIGTVFAGDTLFAGSIGRTDLTGGSHPTLIQSIKSKLLALPDDTQVLPGHGPVTSVQDEKANNPFLNGIY